MFPCEDDLAERDFDTQLVGLLFELLHTPLLHRVSRSFPRVCRSRVQDAVDDAFVTVLEQPELATRAWREGGVDRFDRLLNTIAWRNLRGELRRKATRSEVPVAEWHGLPSSHAPGQEVAVGARRRIVAALDEAARTAGEKNAPAVRQALVDRIVTGDPDTVVAQRHGVRREYLNRAKKQFYQSFFGDDGVV